MTYPLTPRQDRIRVLRARRDQLDLLIKRLEEAERDLDPAEFPDCGSETAYKRHRAHGERACLPCLRAHAETNRTPTPPEKRKRRPSEIPACGTVQGYRRHYQLGEDCRPCKDAYSAYKREQRKAS